MDKIYWNDFYTNGQVESGQTLFAEFVEKYCTPGRKMVDIGCGNGRDSVFFANKGLEVYAVDMSEVAISHLQKKEILHAINMDFVKMLGESKEAFDYLYSRFTIHAISEEEQTKLLHNGYEALVDDGYFFIEVRSKLDDLYGKGELVAKDTYFYNGHRRRFLDKEELEQALCKEGFLIEYSEQSKGFAPYGEADPVILRIVAKKELRCK